MVWSYYVSTYKCIDCEGGRTSMEIDLKSHKNILSGKINNFLKNIVNLAKYIGICHMLWRKKICIGDISTS